MVVFVIVFNSSPIVSRDRSFNCSLINPRITSAYLKTSCFLNASNGYIAGGLGTVLYTSDSGVTWRECPTPKHYPIASLFFHTIQNGWAAGGGGGESYLEPYLINTTNGGLSWMEHDMPELAGGVIRKIKFRNSTDGWITGGSVKNGFVYRTIDGGTTWVNRSPDDLTPPYNVISDILFFDSSTVLICGYHGYMARSTDNGLQWQRIICKGLAPDSIIVHSLEEFQQVAGGVLYCKGQEGILRSDDGGITWNGILYVGNLAIALGGFYFNSADDGFTIGGFGEGALRFVTRNGGSTWSVVPDTVGEVTGQVTFFENIEMGYMIGHQSQIYRISPLGETKVQLNTGYTWVSEPTVDFYNGSNGCIGGPKPIGLRKTADNGKTWQIIDTTADYTGIIQKDENNFALSNGMVSTDGGNTWHQAPDARGSGRTLYKTADNSAVYFIQRNEAGVGVRLFTTRDWFTTAEECQMPADNGTFYFLNADTGWMAFKSLYMTTDGAHSWKEIGPLNGIIGASCINFSDNLQGWVGGISDDNGKSTTILHTSDGGETWQPHKTMRYLPDSLFPPDMPFKGRLPTHICAQNSLIAWFVDGFYGLFYTDDGGDVWQQVALSPKSGDAYVSGTIALAGDGSLFCTGENGMVLRIHATSEQSIRSGVRKSVGVREKEFTVKMPFGGSRKKVSEVYELNGACIKRSANQYSRRFTRPLVVKSAKPATHTK